MHCIRWQRTLRRLTARPLGVALPHAIVVAGTPAGVGKTTVAVGLMRTLRLAGHVVQPFKVGPDFLDPMHHEAACGVASVNLEGWMLGRDGCLAAYHEAMSRKHLVTERRVLEFNSFVAAARDISLKEFCRCIRGFMVLPKCPP